MRQPWLWVACCCAVLTACGGSTPTGPSTSPTLSRSRFLAFGDSLTAGEVTVPVGPRPDLPGAGVLSPPSSKMILVPAASYPTQLVSMLRARYAGQAATVAVSNSGKPGEYSFDGVARLPASIEGAVLVDLY